MTDTSKNPATMTNEELHAHFSELLVSRAEDVDTRLGEFDAKLTNAVDKIDGLEKSFNAKLDARFKEILDRFPAPAPAATHGARLPSHPRPPHMSHGRRPPPGVYRFGCRRPPGGYRCG